MAVAEKVVVAPPEAVLVPAAVEPEVGSEVFVALLLDWVAAVVVVSSLGLLALDSWPETGFCWDETYCCYFVGQ